MAKEDLKLGQMLLNDSIITKEQLEQALTEHKKTSQLIGNTIVSLGFATEEQVLLALMGVMVGLLACLFLYTWWGEVKGHVERA